MSSYGFGYPAGLLACRVSADVLLPRCLDTKASAEAVPDGSCDPGGDCYRIALHPVLYLYSAGRQLRMVYDERLCLCHSGFFRRSLFPAPVRSACEREAIAFCSDRDFGMLL